MKKTKLLMPIIGVVSALSVAAPILTVVSCGNKPEEDKVESISAKYALSTSVLKHTAVKKSDIHVTAKMKDGTSKEVTDWTCDKFTNDTYIISENDKVVFNIKYGNHECKLTLLVNALQSLTFDFRAVEICNGENFKTLKTFNIYTTGLNPQRVSPKNLSFDFDKDDVIQVKCVDEAKDIWAFAPADNLAAGSVENIGVEVVDATSKTKEVLARALVQVNADSVLNVNVAENEASVSVGAGTDLVYPESGEPIRSIFIAPDYVQVDNKIVPVTAFSNPTLITPCKYIQTIIIPNTIKYIPENLFETSNDNDVYLQNIIYNGTKQEFGEIYQEGYSGWMGEIAEYAYCAADGEYIQFKNKIGSTYDSQKKKLISDSTVGALLPWSYIFQIDPKKFANDVDLDKMNWSGLTPENGTKMTTNPTVARIILEQKDKDAPSSDFRVEAKIEIEWNDLYKTYIIRSLADLIADGVKKVKEDPEFKYLITVVVETPAYSTNSLKLVTDFNEE